MARADLERLPATGQQLAEARQDLGVLRAERVKLEERLAHTLAEVQSKVEALGDAA